jgi:hypothetical protein
MACLTVLYVRNREYDPRLRTEILLNSYDTCPWKIFQEIFALHSKGPFHRLCCSHCANYIVMHGFWMLWDKISIWVWFVATEWLPGGIFRQRRYCNFQQYTLQASCFIYTTFGVVKIWINYVTYATPRVCFHMHPTQCKWAGCSCRTLNQMFSLRGRMRSYMYFIG